MVDYNTDIENQEIQPEETEEEIVLEKPRGKRLPEIYKYVGKPNIAEDIEECELNTISSGVTRGFNDDKSSRAHREDRLKKALDLAMQVYEEKNYPWSKASNVKYPLLTMAAIQFASKCYPAIIQDGRVVKGKIIGVDEQEQPIADPNTGQPLLDEAGQPQMQKVPLGKTETGNRISEYMNWELMEEMVDWEEDTDKLLHILPIAGCLFRKTYYGELTGNPISHLVNATDIYVPYDTQSTKTAIRITQTLDMYKNDIIAKQRAGIFLDVDLEIGGGGVQEEKASVKKHTQYIKDKDVYTILEQHTWLDLDEDGYKEPYIVTILKETSQVLRIVARYSRDDIHFNKKGEVIWIEPQCYFTKYGFIPSPDGSFYDMGFGELLYPINESINTTLNMLIDAGHLSNMGGGFIGGNIRMKAGAMRFRTPGEYKIINNFGGSLRDNIVELNQKEPSMVLFQLLGFLNEAGREIASIKDILSGEYPANAPATTTIALIEQGMSVFKAIYKRIHRSLKQEIKKIFKINFMFLDQDDYMKVLDDPEADVKKDFTSLSVDIVPVSDPSMINDMQKMARAQALIQFIDNPNIDQTELHERILQLLSVEKPGDLIKEPVPDPTAQLQLQNVQLQGNLIQEQINSLASKSANETQKTTQEQFKTLADMQDQESKSDIEALKATSVSIANMAKAQKDAPMMDPYVAADVLEDIKDQLIELREAQQQLATQIGGQQQPVAPEAAPGIPPEQLPVGGPAVIP